MASNENLKRPRKLKEGPYSKWTQARRIKKNSKASVEACFNETKRTNCSLDLIDNDTDSTECQLQRTDANRSSSDSTQFDSQLYVSSTEESAEELVQLQFTDSPSDHEFEANNCRNTCFLESDCDTETDSSCSTDGDSNKESNSGTITNSELATWALEYNVEHKSVNALLKMLHPTHTHLPLDSRTLLGTLSDLAKYKVKEIDGGSYVHFGLADVLKEVLCSVDVTAFSSTQTVFIQMNIDGLPLFKSSVTQLWPILGRIVQPFVSTPFVVGVFCGNQKPGNVHEFLEDFVRDMSHLERHPLDVPGIQQPLYISIQCFICDTPARAFVKQSKGHTGYHGCDKCSQTGEWNLEGHKVIFAELDAPVRTDDSFRNRVHPQHHKDLSPIENLTVGMVSQFPLDFMHLVCLGVMRRLLCLWTNSPVSKNVRVSAQSVQRMSQSLENFEKHLPVEFSRKCRSIVEMERWKATEFRQFLLYSGPVILKDALSEPMYDHFLLLFVAIFSLVSPKFCVDAYLNYAKSLLQLFVKRMSWLYGKDTLVYNVHGLIHLADDARNFGPLDTISAFAFENCLGQIKKLVRTGKSPLQQVIRRLHERKGMNKQRRAKSENYVPKKPHHDGPCLPQFSGYSQFRQMYYLVEFTEEKAVAVIPGCWKEGNQCAAWPVGYTANRRAKAVINQEEPPQDDPDWKSFVITDLYWDYDYEKVRRKEKTSTTTSDLNSTALESDSEDDGPRKSKRRKVSRISSGEETENEAEVLISQKKGKAANSHSVPNGPNPPPASSLVPPPLPITGTSYRSQRGSTSEILPSVSSDRSHDYRRNNADGHGYLERGPYRVSSNGVVMNEEVITRLFTNQETLIEMVKQLKEEVQTLKRIQTSGVGPAKRTRRMPEDCRFPLMTMDAVVAMESFLTTPDGVKVVMNELSVCGGTTVHDVVWGIMNKVFHYALAPQFCWGGTKDKKSIKEMKFLSVLCDTVRENPPTEKGKDTEIKHELKEFFRGAHDRLKARIRKENQQGDLRAINVL